MKSNCWLAATLGALIGLSSACTEPLPPATPAATAPLPTGLVALTPTALIGYVGTRIVPTPEVRVLSGSGVPVAGALVEFEVTAGAGSIEAGSVTSNAEGIARVGAWVLGVDAGTNVLRARLPARPSASVEFTAVGQTGCELPCATGRQLAFVREGNIFAVNEDGSGLVQLTSEGKFGQPAWSPDGQQIAFVHGDWPGQIYLINTDGSGLRFFASGWSPAWSPDGRQIAYAASEGHDDFSVLSGQGGIFVTSVENDGTPTRQIGFERGSHDSPAWSPDGSRIAFVSDWAAFDFAFEIYVVNADGSNITQVTDGFFGSQTTWPTYTIYAQPTWSPDGRSLAIVACEEWQFTSCEASSVGVVGLNGTAFRFLAHTEGFAKPAWTPDGSALSFSRTCWEHRCASNVFHMSAAGGSERLLLANAHSAVWRP